MNVVHEVDTLRAAPHRHRTRSGQEARRLVQSDVRQSDVRYV